MKHVAKIWMGIDVSKASFDAALYFPVAAGDPPRHPNSLQKKHFKSSSGPRKALEWARRAITKQAPGGQLCIVMETTGSYSEELAEAFRALDPSLHITIENASTLSHYTKSLNLGNKTDKIDCGPIAHYGAHRCPPATELPPAHYRQLRQWLRQREHLWKQHATMKRRLSELGANDAVAATQRAVLTAIEEQITACESEMAALVAMHEDLRKAKTHICSIPGVGFISAMAILAECGPLTRFRRSRSLTAYTGTIPIINQSGTSRCSSRLSRRGSPILRRILYMAAMKAVQHSPPLAKVYKRLVCENGLNGQQALCAIMRKILILSRALVIKDQDYDPNYASTPAQKSPPAA